ncbi:MAG: DUF4271 domain-containing protein [Flavobacteriales bacterium]|nr:DUF4271 domain-containing protein [Flavobacteriales bacterium]
MIYSDTFFIILTFDLLLIALLKAFYWKFTKQLFLSIFSQLYANLYLKEENVFTERVTFLVTIIMLINVSLFLSKAMFDNNLNLIAFLKVFAFVSVFFLSKAIIIHLFGYIFMLKSLAKLGVFFSFLFDRVMGITLFPIVVLMFFSPLISSPILLIFSVVIVILFLLIKFFWIWKIGIGSFGLSRYYLFLYLCTLEILPLLVFTKAVFY